MAQQVSSETFAKEVLQFDGVVLVDFWASWCGPCQALGPIIDQVTEAVKDESKIKVVKVDVDECSEIAQKYRILSIPTMKFFKGGEVVAEMIGAQVQKEEIVTKLKELV